MRRFITVAFLLLAGFVASTKADAYVGASVMTTGAEIEEAAANFDTDELSWKVFAGSTFFKFLGLEASYRDLGRHEDADGDDRVDADLNAFDVSLRGILPIGNRFRLFAKVGYAYVSTEASFDLEGIVSSFDESEWEKMYGAGLEWTLGGHFGVRAEWEQYDVLESLNSLSVGAYWQF